MQNNSEIDYIAIISACVGVISALVAFLSYRSSVSYNKVSRYNNTIDKNKNNLNACYVSLNEFIDKFSDREECKEKRMARDKTLFLLEVLESELPSEITTNIGFKKSYDDLILDISDLTYEDNLEKIIRNLGFIKNKISSLKENLKEK